MYYLSRSTNFREVLFVIQMRKQIQEGSTFSGWCSQKVLDEGGIWGGKWLIFLCNESQSLLKRKGRNLHLTFVDRNHHKRFPQQLLPISNSCSPVPPTYCSSLNELCSFSSLGICMSCCSFLLIWVPLTYPSHLHAYSTERDKYCMMSLICGA